jgi:hypothetical protein
MDENTMNRRGLFLGAGARQARSRTAAAGDHPSSSDLTDSPNKENRS